MEDKRTFVEWHKAQVRTYAKDRSVYETYAKALLKVLEAGCKTSFPEAAVQVRAKTVASFAEKVARKHLREPKKKLNPVKDFTDLCGARVIVQTTDQVEGVCKFIEANFTVTEKDVKHLRLGDDRVGYRDTHYIVRLRADRARGLGLDAREIRAIGARRAELQVRTWAQHAWADPLHDRMYKAPFEHPAAIRRTGNMVAALLEESDRVLCDLANDIDGKLASFAASALPKDVLQEIEIQRLIFDTEKDQSKRARLALVLARLHAAIGAHGEAVAALRPFARMQGPLLPSILLQLGASQCAASRTKPDGKQYQEGVRHLEAARDLAVSDEVRYAPNLRTQDSFRAKAVFALAKALGPIRNREPEAAGLFKQACGYEPENPYYLASMLGFEMRDGRGRNLPGAMRTQLRKGIETCLQHAGSRIELPASCFTAGRMALVLEATTQKPWWGWGTEALSYYARGLRMILNGECCADPSVLVEEAAWIERLCPAGGARAEDPFRFCVDLLTLGADAAAGKPPRRDACGKLDGPVLLVAGGAAKMPAGKLRESRALLRAALEGFEGTVVAGGTACGIPGLVGDLARELASERKERFRLVGYRAKKVQDDALPHPAYAAAYVVAIGEAYTALQSLQTWVDILHAGIAPSQVRILGFGGGPLSAFDYQVGLALGAQVGVVMESGGGADAIRKDPLWCGLPNLMPLPGDETTLRAFAAPVIEPHRGATEAMARAVHESFLDSRKTDLPENLRDWQHLPGTFKDSSFAQAASGRRLLESHGFGLKQAKAPRIFKGFTRREIEAMAAVEHGRWSVERLRAGWKPGPRDNQKKTHDCLLTWKKLPEKIKQLDRNAVRNLPAVLAKAGWQVVRK